MITTPRVLHIQIQLPVSQTVMQRIYWAISVWWIPTTLTPPPLQSLTKKYRNLFQEIKVKKATVKNLFCRGGYDCMRNLHGTSWVSQLLARNWRHHCRLHSHKKGSYQKKVARLLPRWPWSRPWWTPCGVSWRRNASSAGWRVFSSSHVTAAKGSKQTRERKSTTWSWSVAEAQASKTVSWILPPGCLRTKLGFTPGILLRVFATFTVEEPSTATLSQEISCWVLGEKRKDGL